MSGRFSYIKYDEDATRLQARFKELFEKIEATMDERLDEGRSTSLAYTKLEEAYMWIGKAIRDQQRLERSAVEQPERKDG